MNLKQQERFLIKFLAKRSLIKKKINKKENDCLILTSASPEKTLSIGKRIAALLSSGSVVALKGNLGSGKTSLAKGIAAGLGIQDNLTSPTYTIISEYPLKRLQGNCKTLYHIDAYRLEDDTDFEAIGGAEILASGGICIIEWSERIPKSMPDNAITIIMEITGPSSRLIRIKGLNKL